MKIFLPVLLMLFVIGTANAQDITLTTKSRSAYLGGNGAIFYGNQVQHSDVWIQWKNGVYLDVWHSVGFNGKRDFDKEVDWTVGKSGSYKGLDYSVDFNHYMLVIIDAMGVNAEVSHTHQFFPRLSVGPYLRLESYFPVQKTGPRKGLFGTVGIRTSSRINSKTSLILKDWFKKDSGAFAFDPALLNQGYAGLTVNITKQFAVTPGVNFSVPISRVRDGREGEAVWEIAVSYSLHHGEK